MSDGDKFETVGRKIFRRRRMYGKKASFQISTPIEEYKALFDHSAHGQNELSFQKGDRIEITDKNEEIRLNWWKGRVVGVRGKSEGVVGYVPKMYITKIRNASKQMRVLPRMINSKEVELKEMIGKGGFAIVRRGEWRGREVAVKIISDSSIKEMVQNEAKIIWLLRHPNIISLMGVYALEKDYCLVMEFVKGGSLCQHLKQNFLSPSCIVDWASQIAEGMNYLHHQAPTQAIIHRDLKSTNVLISEEPDHTTLKITDFGLARQSSETIVVTNAAGTFEWMAPEVFRDHRVCRESDVWSFGVVFWELLTSQVPYKNFNQFQIVFGVGKNILQLPIPHLCPQDFIHILEICWNRDPKQRPDFPSLLRRLEKVDVSVMVDDEAFKKLQQEWVLEIDRQLDEKKSQSTKQVAELTELHSGQEYLSKIIGGIKQQYMDIQRMEMELIEKQIYYAVKMMNGVKKKPKRCNFNLFGRKDITISRPTDFQHRFQTVVEQTDVSPNFHLQRLRFTEVKENEKRSSQDDTKSNPEEKVGFLEGLRGVFSTMLSPNKRAQKRKIIANNRLSMFPPTSTPPFRPTNLALSTSHLPSASSTLQNKSYFSKRVQSIENSPFKIEIIQTPTKSKVYVTGNSPTTDFLPSNPPPPSNYSTLPSRSSSTIYTINSTKMRSSKYASITSIKYTPDYFTLPLSRRFNNDHQTVAQQNSLQILRDAQNVTELKKFFNKLTMS